jgi:2'-5' RNA ligase
MPYMIALIPSQKSAEKYILAAQELFSSQNSDRLLSKESTPHVTLCQFECEESLATSLWEEFKKLSQPSLMIRFVAFSFVKGIAEHEGYYWAELSIARDMPLLNLYQKVLNFIQKKKLPIINDYGDYYRPHLTLARIQLPYTIRAWPNSLLDTENFTLGFMPCFS